MNRMKKCISLLLIITILCSLVTIINISANATDSSKGNVLINSDFENGLTGWIVHPNCEDWQVGIEENNNNGIFHTGQKTLRIRHQWTNIRQENISLEANTDYTLTFYARRVGVGNSTFDVTVETMTSPSNVLVKISPTESSDFVKYTAEFNSGSNTTVKFYIRGNGGNGNTYSYIDDISISSESDEEEQPEESISAIVNSDFENGLTGWIVHPNCEDWQVGIEENNNNGIFHTGQKTLRIRHQWTNIRQENISLESNTDYTLTFYARRVGVGNSILDVTVETMSSPSNVLVKVSPTESSDFVKYTAEFNSGSNTTVKFYIRGNNGDANTYSYIDDIVIEKSLDGKSGNLLLNGGFEDGEDGWTLHSSAKITEDIDKAHSGTKFFNINQNFYSKSYQTVSLKKNTDYYYCFWYKVKNPAASVEWNFKLKDVDNTEVKLNDTENKWKKHFGTFNSGSLTETQFIIENNGEHGEFFIDDCVIVLESESSEYKDQDEPDTPENPDEPDTPEEPDKPEEPDNPENEIVFGGNLLVNNGFEDGLANWTVNKTNDWAVQVVSNVHNGGNNSLQLRHSWIKVTQTISANKNSDYELTFFSKRIANGTTTTVRVYGSDGTTRTLITSYDVEESSTFIENKINFNSGKNNSIIIWIESNNGYDKAYTYFDDFVLAKAEGNDPLYFDKNSSIIQGSTDDKSFIVKFKNVSSIKNPNKINYSIYCSEEPIDGKNITSLTPIISNIDNDEKRGHKITGLKENTGYYIAVKAVDEEDNVAYLRSGTIFTTMTSEQMKNIVKCGENIIVDGSFESNKFFDDTAGDKDKTPYFWHNYGGVNKDDGNYNATFNKEQAYTGTTSLRTYPWTFQVRQVVDVKTHTDYSLSYKAFSYKNGLKVEVYGIKSNGLITAINAEQTFDFQRYEGTFNSGDNAQLMICVTNNVSGCHIAFVDDIIMVEIDNQDLYVAGEVVRRDYGDDFITVGWDPVNSSSELKDITYNLYMSESKITEENIGGLTAISSFSGDSETYYCDVWDIIPEKDYWFVVGVSDKLGNTVYMYSREALSIPTPEEYEEDEEEDEDLESLMPDDEYLIIEEDDDTPKTKFVTVNKPKYIKKCKKVYHLVGMSTKWIIILVSSISVGVLLIATIVLIILKKKGILRRRK